MDASHVTFGRRGLPHDDFAPATAHVQRPSHEMAVYTQPEPVPNRVVERSIPKLLMYTGLIWLVVFFTAGSRKHSNDLPYWLWSDVDQHLQYFLFPLVFCVLATFLILGPALRRPVILRLFDDHFEFVPLIGRVRSVKWSLVGDITQSTWSRYRRLYIEVCGERRISFRTAELGQSRDEIIVLLEHSRRQACSRSLHLSSEGIDSRYLFPGH